MKAFEALHLFLLLSVVTYVPLRAQNQTCKFLNSLNLLKNFTECPAIRNSSLSGMFYIKLTNAQGYIEDCEYDHNDNSFTKMCGEKLMKRDEIIRDTIQNFTCPSYHTITAQGPLGVCEQVLNNLGYCVTFEPYNISDSEYILLYNESSLRETVTQIETRLQDYFNVVDRTLVGSYFNNHGHRCLCLDTYRKWLCSISLNMFMTTNEPNTFCSNQSILNSINETLVQFKPCLSMCHRVVQSCPYYLPSSFQRNEDKDFDETVYGGYPAFDCPRTDTLRLLYNNGSCEMCTYAPPDCSQCIGQGGATSLKAVISKTVRLWTLFVITCLVLVFM